MNTLIVLRVAYGALLLATLISALPHARRYFLSERWGGYAKSSGWVDWLHNPVAMPIVLAVWMASAACLVAGIGVVWAAGVNLALCHYFFIQMRWRGVLRGMGAPGFIAYWLGAAVFIVELTARYAPGAAGIGLLTLRIDFGLIMLSAGLYKRVAGYRSGNGMELGMANPEWGYWAPRWSAWPPRHGLFRVLNEAAWGTEVGAGLLMLIPQTRWAGGLAMALSFVFIATQIRLGFLCEMVIVACLLFAPVTLPASGGPIAAHAVLERGLVSFFVAYLLLLPLARAGLFYNQLAHRPLPRLLQRGLDAFANAFGLILWRVFSADVVNFFVRIWEESPDGERRLVSDYVGWPWTNRFRQVAECIAITSIFTTRRYYPSNQPLFVERLLRYARTIPHDPAGRLMFEWVDVARPANRFAYVPVAEYRVDVRNGTVEDTTLVGTFAVEAPAPSSPVHEGVRPGSYAPAHPRRSA